LGNLSKSQFGPFSIDVRERVLRRHGHPVPLTPKAFDLLAALVDQPGQLISKDELLQKVWPDTFVEESNLTYNVFALRKALGDSADNAQYIETVPKRGYRFAATVTPLVPENGGPPAAESAAETGSTTFDGEPGLSIVPELDGAAEAEKLPLESSAQTRIPARSSSRRRTLLAVAAIALAALYFAVQSRRPSSEPTRALPLTSLPGVVRSPSFSPDGNFVAFSWTDPKQENSDVYVQQIGAGSPLRLTVDPGNDLSPSWSPDGRTIAFLRRAPSGQRIEVWLIPPLGGPERKVADIQPGIPLYRPISIAWCPDSSCVLVTDSQPDGKRGLFAISLETGEKRQLTFSPTSDADPAISPNGRSLVFRRGTTPFSGAFYRMSLEDQAVPKGEPVRLTSTLNAGRATWTADGREILFGARGGLWRLDALGGGTPTRLPFVGQDGLTPAVSRTADGRQRLVYVRSFADTNVWRVDTYAAGAAASSPPIAAIASTRSDHIPNLSPDPGRVVFLSDRSGESELWLADLDGSNAVQRTKMAIDPGFPRWSPDGKQIAFHGDPEERPDVLVMPAAGGTPRILTRDMPNGGFPSFSRDGKWIYFTVRQREKGEPRIWKKPTLGGAAVQVTPNAGTLAIESPDGRDLYYLEAADRPSSLWRLPLAGGQPVKVVDGIVLGNFDVIDGGIYYIDRVSGEAGVFFSDRPRSEARLQYFDFATRRSTTVAHNLGTVGFGLSASRDGRTILYSRIDSSIDELMLVDNFR
jgi:Tol biopolymer transport system component/DNA-binding winged helix-turn-helix (wHTH) protein